MRRAAKRDFSEPDIIDALRKCGWSVLQVSVKDGPDLFASRRAEAETVTAVGPFLYPTRVRFSYQRVVAIECKSGKRKLRPGQEAFKANWQGEYVVMRNVDDVLKLTANTGESA